jgi:hypothetical protein
MAATTTLSGLLVVGLLVVSLVGVLMGINRTMKTREHENGLLQSLAAGLGLLLMAVSIFALFQGNAAKTHLGYTVLIMMILGLSLCGRQLERIHFTLVFALVAGLGIVWAIGHFGMPRSGAALMQKENISNLLIAGGVIVLGAAIMIIFTIEKIIDLFLGIVGLGPIVILLSGIGLAHAIIILSTGNTRGVMQYLP